MGCRTPPGSLACPPACASPACPIDRRRASRHEQGLSARDEKMKNKLLLFPLAAALSLLAPALAQTPGPARAWTPAQVQELLDKTQTTRLAPNLTHLSAGEQIAVGKLLEVGRIFQDVYEAQRHRDALTTRAALARRTDQAG